MTYGEVRKTIIFKLDDPEQRAMYEQIVTKTNFSKLVKRFLAAELQRMRAAQQQSLQQTFNQSNAITYQSPQQPNK
ncbi:hypothetical protein DNHGIG_00840 [Collibacillus ludicampi]|uniref:Uncharacterized protein n=1 Tax=Collibacillus ludicampi TaxID=2771369 RepID=A0AAV4L9S4_9BACL|nr:hypothetical protein [Collibacillus ludicampi]GIM44535.1 hypothetical protein DNHGIG_00840 [Collibacillus ludicampi]